MRSAIVVVGVALAVACSVGACEVEEPVPGAIGEGGVLAFEAPTDLVFSERTAIGSTFSITARFVAQGENAGAFSDSVDVGVNSGIAEVSVVERSASAVTFSLSVTGGGTTSIAITEGDTVVDRINVRSVPLAETFLVDASLLSISDRVDVTLPSSFSLLRDLKTTFGIAAIDRCGQGVIDLNASTLELVGDVPDDSVTIASTGLGGFEVTAGRSITETVEFDLVLQTPGLEPLRYAVQTALPSDIDELRAEVAAVDGEAGSATVWARALVDGRDVVGVDDFRWSSSQRVTLSLSTGPANTLSVGASTVEGEESPATVTLEAFGEDDEVDLFALQETDLVASRGAGPKRDTAPQNNVGDAVGCPGDVPACDPLAALLPVLALPRLRRRRRR